jgi:hypothetical protein
MKSFATACVIVFGLAVWGCRARYPDSYGIYADTGFALQQLAVGQNLEFDPKEYVKHKFGGRSDCYVIKAPVIDMGLSPDFAASAARTLRRLIVYDQVFESQLSPSALEVTKFCYQKRTIVWACPVLGNEGYSNLYGMWLPCGSVSFKVRPVEARRGMYLLDFEKPLPSGVYALHVAAHFSMAGKRALGVFVVGEGVERVKLDAEERVERAFKQAREDAMAVVKKFNEIYNRGELRARVGEVYRPKGSSPISADTLAGFEVWREEAGSIKSTEFEPGDVISDDLSEITLYATTVYERKGSFRERYDLRKIDGRWFVVHMESWRLE